MFWTRLFRRTAPAFPRRKAILKGGGELENLGDVMMRHEAEALIASLGFDIVHRVGHGEITPDVARGGDDIDAIFVLGSIQYSDAWPQPTLLERLERSIRFHRHFPRAKVVFLPATWGGFTPEHREALQSLVGGAIVFVRDRFSADCINGLLGRHVADYCPDLAFGYPTAAPGTARPLLERTLAHPAKPILGIVPNQRCVEPGVTPVRRPADYIEALVRVRDHAETRGFNVIAISHMLQTDRDLMLMRDLGITCVPVSDVAETRSLIANLALCVCSRYHGLISCLSHGVPVLALGWHHKYRNVMQDMGLADYHVSVADLPRDLSPILDAMHANRASLHRTIVDNVAAARRLIRTRTAALPEALNDGVSR